MQGNTHHITIKVLFVLSVFFLIAACQSQAENTGPLDSEPATTPTVQAVAESESMDEETSTEDPVAEVQSPDECILCHTDKQMLIDTAKPEEEVVEENEGAG